MHGLQREAWDEPYSLGTFIVLETIIAAHRRKTKLPQCTSTPSFCNEDTSPKGSDEPTPTMRPCLTQVAMIPTRNRDDGMGRPSMYFDLPVLSLGTSATVALNRARRAIPAQMKMVRRSVSTGVLIPTQKANTAGATPNEICDLGERDRGGVEAGRTESASESSSWPSMELSLRQRATLPSNTSKIIPANGYSSACQRCRSSNVTRYRAEEKSEREPQKPLPSVTMSASRKLLQPRQLRARRAWQGRRNGPDEGEVTVVLDKLLERTGGLLGGLVDDGARGHGSWQECRVNFRPWLRPDARPRSPHPRRGRARAR